jgi:hypothetical protein
MGEVTAKERVLGALRVKEQTLRERVAALRERHVAASSAVLVSEVIRLEARADQIREDIVIVEQDGAVF